MDCGTQRLKRTIGHGTSARRLIISVSIGGQFACQGASGAFCFGTVALPLCWSLESRTASFLHLRARRLSRWQRDWF